MEIKKSFPVLEEFLLQLQPSTLEKIKGSNTKLNRKIEFVAEYLKDGISEDTLFNILRELDVRRIRFRCQQMLKMVRPYEINLNEELIIHSDHLTDGQQLQECRNWRNYRCCHRHLATKLVRSK